MRDNPANLSSAKEKKLIFGLLRQKSTRVFPLSLGQQRLWYLDQLHPGIPAYNVAFGMRLRGNLNRPAIEASVQEITKRHDILRSTFKIQADNLVQIVAADSQIKIPALDLRHIADSNREAEAYRIGLAEAQISFDLEAGPVLRLKLIRLRNDEHVFICVMHHIVCDAWSTEVFVRELAAFYEQHIGGQSSPPADLPIQYGDFAKWQHEWIAGDRLAKQVHYWKQKLAGAPAYLPLPADHLRPLEQTYDGASQVILAPNELIRNMRILCRKWRATLFMVLLAIFKTLLYCYTAVEDILVGVPVSGRNHVELEGLIGFFLNILVIRSSFSGNPRFSDLLLRVREVVLDAFAHADLSFDTLVKELNPPRTLSYSPLVQVMFSVVKAWQFPRLGEITASPYLLRSRTSIFDISMQVIEDQDDRVWLAMEYSTSLFDSERIATMLNQYIMLLKAIVDQPEARVLELGLLLKRR